MDIQRIEGIIVHTIPFQEHDCIMSVLTPEEGLIKFIFKGASHPKKGGSASTIPLTLVQIIYTRGKSELLRCREITILNHHLNLRNRLNTLEAACDMLQTITATQLPGKSCAPLYQLLLAYLNKLPSAHDPATLSASFRLKTLRHEGFFRFDPTCSQCALELSDSHIFGTTSYCKNHAPLNALPLSVSEKEIFILLAFSRDLSLLSSLPMTSDLTAKAKQLFEHALNQ